MKLSMSIKRLVTMLVALSLLGFHTAPLQAAMVGSGELLAEQSTPRQQLLQLFERDGVSAELEALGVDPEQAKSRVARMSDAEVAKLHGQLQELPAGSGVVEIVLLLFIIFLITDMLGATDIFPFVNSINN